MMDKRPFAVTALSWLFILVGAAELAVDIRRLSAHPFHREDIWIGLVHLLAIVAGAFMLRGDNWARWLAVIWIGGHVAITVLNAWHGFLVHAIFFAGIAFLLFRADARGWFRRRITAGT
jgi:hypothetical protein